MPSRQPPCPRCQRNLFVRTERVISGRRVSSAYYCGACDYDWEITDKHMPERRINEQQIIPRMVVIREKRDRRKMS